ncbi:hypothetical protein [Anaeromyxobacter diazotrophicus]|uniref:Uncharacterized protein n=1 Tax=Anaeromyxobacter diazotrophicus TaxID=2590199 RepID=A0A7I9VS42_9BACT|nr:hypothetical protein [Anaeromyxobacter diazotrophicus]GEJ59264.1 hypothetical protein AMYX_40050 [Anaeromyxobacter diazotrophicus]
MHWFLVAALALAAEPAAAPPPQPSAEEQKKLEEEIAKELGAAPGGAAAAPAPAGAPPVDAAPAPAPGPGGQAATGGNPYARILMLPDISAIGDFAGTYHNLDVGSLSPRSGLYGAPHEVTPHFEELELGLQSVVDPYARADIFISFTPAGVDVEEAYLTTLTLPAGFQVRAGKFLSPFGRLNQQHPHVWDFVDAPLAMDRLLSADALKGPGVDVAWLAPLPWFAELHLAGQTTRPSFVEEDRRTVVARLQQYFEVGEGATLGVGLSGARIQEPLRGASREVGGADLMLKVRPVNSRSYVVLQGEVFARRMRGTEEEGTASGGYLQAVFRDGPFYAYGVRGELAPAVVPGTTLVTSGSGTERRVSALAEWLPSEFQRLRAQVAWDHLPGGRDGFEATLHLEFVIGAHGAHPF